MKIDTMINNLFTLAPWKKVALIVPVLFVTIVSSQAQSKVAQDSILVKGVVVSGTNTPLSDITISIEGSMQLPVVTNAAGEFSIKSAAPDNWLIISPVSDYKTKRIFLNNRSELKVYLTASDLTSGDDPLNILSQKKIKRILFRPILKQTLTEATGHLLFLSMNIYREKLPVSMLSGGMVLRELEPFFQSEV